MYGLRGYSRGLGVLDYYDLLAQAGLKNCDPMDSACVSGNVAKQADVEDFWAAHQSTGVPDNTVLTFTPQTQEQVTEFYNPANLNFGGNVVDDKGIMHVAGVPPSWLSNYPPSPAPASPTLKPAVSTPPRTASPAGSAAQGAPALSSTLTMPDFSGLSFSALPWWAWAGAAVGAVLLMGGGQRSNPSSLSKTWKRYVREGLTPRVKHKMESSVKRGAKRGKGDYYRYGRSR